MNEMYLRVLRHGESWENVLSRGDEMPKDVPRDCLSDFGREQAEGVSQQIGLGFYDHIYVSPHNRTIQTIGPALVKQNRTANVLPLAAEVPYHNGLYMNKVVEAPDATATISHSEYTQSFYPQLTEVSTKRLPWPSTEKRIIGAVRDVARKIQSKGGRVLLVSHGQFLSKLVEWLLRAEHARFHFWTAHYMDLIISDEHVMIKNVNQPAYDE